MNVTGVSPAGTQGASGGGQSKVASPTTTTNPSNTTATITNQTRAIVSK
jgi:hypothetical protein